MLGKLTATYFLNSIFLLVSFGVSAEPALFAQDRRTAVEIPLPITNYQPCCMLGLYHSFPLQNLKAQAATGQGVIYTSKAGFIDLGHLRYCVYSTKYLYDQIKAISGAPGQIITVTGKNKTREGTAQIHKPIPEQMWIKVARAISYDSSVAYECETWFLNCYTCHTSSFSPEDLPSNYLGTYVAEVALERANKSAASFDEIVNGVIAETILSLEPESEAGTHQTFKLINNCWVNYRNVDSYDNPRFLTRRNFDYSPVKWWNAKSGMSAALPALITDLGEANQFYTYTYSIRNFKILNTAFPSFIAKIKELARKKYGSQFASPQCR